MFKMLSLICVMIVAVVAYVQAVDPLDKYLTSPDLKRVWSMLQRENYSAASAMRIKFQDDKASLSIYHYLYAKVLSHKRRYLDAIDHYGMAASAFSSVKSADIPDLNKQILEVSLLERAHLYYKIEYYYEAKALFTNFIANYPASRFIDTANVGMAESLLELGQQKEAMEYANKITSSTAAPYIKANIYQSLGDIKNADELYRSAIKADKGLLESSDSTRYYYGENLRQMDNLPLAKRYLVQVIDKPYSNRALISLGLIELKSDNTYSALQKFSSALASNDWRIKKEATLNIIDTYMLDKKPLLARPYILEAKKFNSTQEEKDRLDFIMIKTYRLNGEYEKASVMLKNFIAKHGMSYNGVLEETEGLLMDYMEKAKGKFPDLWKEYGSIFYENKNMKIIYMARDALKDSGKQYMDIVIWLSNNGPDEVKADNLKELAQLKALSGDPAGTLVYTNQLRKMGESGDWMIRLEALAYYLSKQNAMAFATLKNIKSLNQKDIDMIRETFIADKDLHKSILYYEDVIEKKGGKIADYMKLADVYYFDLKNNEKAIQYYKLALKTEPDNGWVSYMIAILSNNIEDAKKIYEKIKVQNTVYGKLAGTILQQHITAKKVSEVQ